MKFVIYFFTGILITLSAAYSAPHPSTSSSFLIGQEKGRFFSQHGFLVNSAETQWIHKSPPKGIANVETIYSAPNRQNGVQASLTVRVDSLKKNRPLKTYLKKWNRDYHRFGFEILQSRKVKVGKNTAEMLDLIHAKSQKQLRQVIFVKNHKAVTFTCRDHQKSFRKHLKDCNQIIRSFRWTI